MKPYFYRFLAVFAPTVCLTAGITVAYFTGYDAGVGHLTTSAYEWLLYLAAVLFSAVSGIFTVLASRKSPLPSTKTTRIYYSLLLFVGAAAFLVGFTPAENATSKVPEIFSYLAAAFALVLAVLSAASLFTDRFEKHAALPACVALASVLVAVSLYFDNGYSMNHPMKLLWLLGLSAAAFAFLADGRAAITKGKDYRAFFFAFAATCGTATALSHIFYAIAAAPYRLSVDFFLLFVSLSFLPTLFTPTENSTSVK